MTEEADVSREIGFATNGEIADIIEQLGPVLDQYPIDQKLIAVAATLLIVIDPNIGLDDLKTGVDILITAASKFIATGTSGDEDWEPVSPAKMN